MLNDWIMRLRIVNALALMVTLIAMASKLTGLAVFAAFALGWISCRIDAAERERKSQMET